jgi:hypothetical protein
MARMKGTTKFAEKAETRVKDKPPMKTLSRRECSVSRRECPSGVEIGRADGHTKWPCPKRRKSVREI